jgi:NAD(P)-dependent dehydrogenase (short-subunit alcohol dehydrogenase family)
MNRIVRITALVAGIAIQRGSVIDTQYPGDPLTPGVAATPNAKRLTLQEAVTITKIPVLPVSYADAQPLLAEVRGRVAPREWRGSLPITYHLDVLFNNGGTNAAAVPMEDLTVEQWNTEMTERMATGAIQPNGSKIVGPRIDAWHVAEAVLYMANLPLEANVPFMIVMATAMPFAGHG